jgi:hypothetical protein
VILGAAGRRFDAINQSPGLVRAEVDFLKAFEQLQA